MHERFRITTAHLTVPLQILTPSTNAFDRFHICCFSSHPQRLVDSKCVHSPVARMSDRNNDTRMRRSRRIATSTKSLEEQKLYNDILKEVKESEMQADNNNNATDKPTTSASQATKKRTGRKKAEDKTDPDNETLFDHGEKAVRIVGATTVEDEGKGVADVCYLVKYESGQLELVINTVAHKHCPMVSE